MTGTGFRALPIDFEPSFSNLSLPPGEDLVAVGGALTPEIVHEAYRHGVFPWFDEGQPVQWWSPDPRAVLPLQAMPVSRRLRRTLRQGRFEISRNRCFERVMRACGARGPGPGWIHEAMIRCYVDLHAQGHAHSLEVWVQGALAGGVYGVGIGGLFAAESMFHVRRDMSKVALVQLATHLSARGYALLDAQFWTPHLDQFGCTTISRAVYLSRLRACRDDAVTFDG